MHCIYHFFAIILHMSIVKMLCKDDYWSNENVLPIYFVCLCYHATRNRFRFMWRHIYLNCGNKVADDEDEIEGNVVIERRNRNKINEDEEEENAQKKVVWFEKLFPLVNHFRNVSTSMIRILGSNISIDEMII